MKHTSTNVQELWGSSSEPKAEVVRSSKLTPGLWKAVDEEAAQRLVSGHQCLISEEKKGKHGERNGFTENTRRSWGQAPAS